MVHHRGDDDLGTANTLVERPAKQFLALSPSCRRGGHVFRRKAKLRCFEDDLPRLLLLMADLLRWPGGYEETAGKQRKAMPVPDNTQHKRKKAQVVK